MKQFAAVALFVIAFLAVISPIRANEGMWSPNNLPKDYLKQHYNFDVTDEWVKHVQLSSARLPNCSSSFVSGDGLVMTNGHCAEKSVQALSTPQNNLYENGFYARTYTQELKTDRDLKILISIKDVTQEVNESANKSETVQRIQRDKIGLSASDMLNTIRQDGRDPFICEVVLLYQGAQYYNYCYKVYDDVRLVFSTEKNIWFMGGDADNFEYPRYAIDIAFFRVYENGKPLKTPEYFTWSKAGVKEDELIFVSGHPGRTARLLTSLALKTERDVRVPFLLDLFRRREITLQQFTLRGKEQRRIAESDLSSWQNSRKLYVGKIRGLQDPRLMNGKEDFEKKFYKDFYTNAGLSNKFANGLIMVCDAQQAVRKNYARSMLLNRGLGFDSRLFGYARSLVLGHKQSEQAVLDARDHEEPLNLEYEEAKLTDSLTHLIEVFGAEDPFVIKLMLYGSGPANIAQKLVYGTSLSDVNEHRNMTQAGDRGLQQNDDIMVNFALLVESESEIYKKLSSDAAEQERRGYSLINQALFQGYGTNIYPDATFTLRLSFGMISGYGENERSVSPFTTIGGAYKHSAEFGNKGDYKLPAKWRARKKYVNLKTPLNFVSNLDITGGNSGSPVFNGNREIVGIIFDSNIEGLVSDYDFNYAPNARAVAVHSSGIIEVIKKIYRADRLVAELTRN